MQLEPVARRGFLATVFAALVSPWLPKKELRLGLKEPAYGLSAKGIYPHQAIRGKSFQLVWFDEVILSKWNYMQNISGKEIEAGQMIYANYVSPVPQESCHENYRTALARNAADNARIAADLIARAIPPGPTT